MALIRKSKAEEIWDMDAYFCLTLLEEIKIMNRSTEILSKSEGETEEKFTEDRRERLWETRS